MNPNFNKLGLDLQLSVLIGYHHVSFISVTNTFPGHEEVPLLVTDAAEIWGVRITDDYEHQYIHRLDQKLDLKEMNNREVLTPPPFSTSVDVAMRAEDRLIRVHRVQYGAALWSLALGQNGATNWEDHPWMLAHTSAELRTKAMIRVLWDDPNPFKPGKFGGPSWWRKEQSGS